MDITEKIKSYKDACKELGLNPKNLPIVDSLPEKDQKSIIAYYKLVIIIRALNEGWEPDFSDRTQYKYWVWSDTECDDPHYSGHDAWIYLGSFGHMYAYIKHISRSVRATLAFQL